MTDLTIYVANRIVEYDHKTAIALLQSGQDTIKVDVSLVLDDVESANLVRTGHDVFVIGSIECISEQKEGIKLNCIQIFDCNGLDLNQWEQAARKMSQLIYQRATGKG